MVVNIEIFKCAKSLERSNLCFSMCDPTIEFASNQTDKRDVKMRKEEDGVCCKRILRIDEGLLHGGCNVSKVSISPKKREVDGIP